MTPTQFLARIEAAGGAMSLARNDGRMACWPSGRKLHNYQAPKLWCQFGVVYLRIWGRRNSRRRTVQTTSLPLDWTKLVRTLNRAALKHALEGGTK